MSIDHRTFSGALPSATKRILLQPSTASGIIHLIGHMMILAVGAVWIANGWALWWMILPLHGIALVFLFTLQHECTHKTPFTNLTLNEIVGHACGILLVNPFTWFRYFHLAHHKWTNIPQKDPELSEPKPETVWQFAKHISGLPYWIGMFGQVVRNAKGELNEPYVPSTAIRRIQTEARLMLLAYAILGVAAFFVPALIWIWLLPAVLGQPFLRVYLLAEHGRCPQVANMFANTRTTFTTGLVRFLAWNMPYHAEHHVFPNVPFYNLPALHLETKKHLCAVSDGYTEFAKNYIRNLHEGQ